MFIVRKKGAQYMIEATSGRVGKYRMDKKPREQAVTFKKRASAQKWATHFQGEVVGYSEY